ncbi:Polynucleotidyl transferase- ribonuclease H-like superfamily protein [Striga hermonthica]|uniref:Polynucleotidyl transferase- ribonuclease H-like superfamily protein n=1 Tax=Striga hermonthica TaxID=68872 RepID=A0A9N7RC21_STRHE|nr:Polynucleotidyl transferase- ribonuclease H-like superfamily protein [Striga hermonthica]
MIFTLLSSNPSMGDHGLVRTPILVKWNAPPSGWMKVNTDGMASGSPGNAAIGLLFRNGEGKVVFCFSATIGIRFAFQADLLAAIRAIDRYFFIPGKKVRIDIIEEQRSITSSLSALRGLPLARGLCRGHYFYISRSFSSSWVDLVRLYLQRRIGRCVCVWVRVVRSFLRKE